MGQAQFLVYPWFICFKFFFWWADPNFSWPDSEWRNLWCLNLSTENLWIFYSSFCAKYISFLCYWSAWFEASVEYSKYVIHGMCQRLSSEISQQLRLMVQSEISQWLQDGAIRSLNSLCVVVAVSCWVSYRSKYFASNSSGIWPVFHTSSQ